MELLESDLDPDPLVQFRRWLADATARVPEAMALATATADGAPSVRMVLLKQADEDGFVFHTSYESRKGRELEANPRAALLFHWDGRQVRIEGAVERVTEAESDAYYATRPPGARAAAWAARQSEPVGSRTELEEAFARVTETGRPTYWGGYRLRPESYEFWQHRDDRLHDRLRYERDGTGWRVVRLGP